MLGHFTIEYLQYENSVSFTLYQLPSPLLMQMYHLYIDVVLRSHSQVQFLTFCLFCDKIEENK